MNLRKHKLLYRIQYQGNGKAPDKRFDKSIPGLCLFLYPTGMKTFYAVKLLELCIIRIKIGPKRTLFIRKIFRMEDHPQRDYAAAKLAAARYPDLDMSLNQKRKKTKRLLEI